MRAIPDSADPATSAGAVLTHAILHKPRIAVISPFLDMRHGTERAMIECISRLAGDYEFHIYSNRVEDLDLASVVWHRVPSLPGPHLFSYLWWFFANTFWRWRDRRFAGSRRRSFSPRASIASMRTRSWCTLFF